MRLGPFTLEGPLGHGGMGMVWRARHDATGLPVAIKVLAGGADDPKRVEGVRNEVRAVACLDHPAIVRILEQGEVPGDAAEASEGLLPPGGPWFAMEHATGGSLSKAAPETWAEVREVLEQVLDGLAHAHARGVVHRDLKPANVLVCTELDARPGLKLCDFGIAYAYNRDDARFDPSLCTGTPQYMAPEQVTGRWRDQGPWTDLYALGMLAWRLVCGKPAFHGRGVPELLRAQVEEPPPPLAPRVPVPSGFEGWARRLLEKEPERRWAFAAEAAQALLDLGEATGRGSASPAAGDAATVRLQLDSGATTVLDGPRPTLAGLGPGLPAPGAARPVPPWRAPSPPPLPISLTGAGLALFGLRTPPLVGRTAERDRLWNALADVALTRRSALIVVRGPAGCGKTRLADWLLERADELGVTRGHRLAGADPARRLVQRVLGMAGLADEGATERAREVLNHLAIGSPARERLAAGEPDAGALWTLLSRLSGDRPTLVLLDDLASAEIHGLAEGLLRIEGPLLLVGTIRDDVPRATAERIEALTTGVRRDVVEIEPLSKVELEDLAAALLHLDRRFRRLVGVRAKGSPQFLVELLGDWVQRGLLMAGPRGYELTVEDPPLPDDLHAVWASRVEALLADQTASARLWLERAAFLGQEVALADWREACPEASPHQLALLVELLAARRWAGPAPDGFAFAQPMLRESLVRIATEAGRAPAHHAACARMLLVRPEEPERDARLGRHLVGAGDDEAAYQPLSRALAAIGRRNSHRGLALASILEQVLRRLDPSERGPRWAAFWDRQLSMHIAQGMPDRAREMGQRAVAIAAESAPERLAELHQQLARASLYRVDPDLPDVVGHLAEAQAAALRHRQTGEGLRALYYLVDVLWRRGQADLAEALLTAIIRNSAEVPGTLHWHSRRELPAFLARRGEYAAARAEAETCRAWYAANGLVQGVLHCDGSLAQIALAEGDLRDAERRYLDLLERTRELGNPNTAAPLLALGIIALREQRWAEAERRLERAREGASAANFGSNAIAPILVALLACAAGLGQWERADQLLTAASERRHPDARLFADLVAPAFTIAEQLAAEAGHAARAAAIAGLARQFRD